MFTISYAGLTAFNAGCAASQNIQTLVVLRFLAGAFGSSPLTNAGGVIADMCTNKHLNCRVTDPRLTCYESI